MKKVISVLVIMAVFSTTLFAAPLSVAGSWDKPSQEVSRTELSAKADMLNEFDDLFVEVNAVALTTEEAQAVEGEGFISGFITGVMQWGTGAAVMGTNGTGQQQAASMLSSAIISGLFGGVCGLFVPIP
ncbi:hypothetical protein Holit_03104 [Hollandina sp. SP2]